MSHPYPQQGKGYPSQKSGPPPQNPYPTHQGYYPGQQQPPGMQPGMAPNMQPMPPHFGQRQPEAPPPYTPHPPPQQYYPQQPVTYVTQQPMQAAAYDPGARFDAGARPNVPPPPPGYAPNAAQVAAAQGQPVVMTQRRADWVSGGPGGGYTFW